MLPKNPATCTAVIFCEHGLNSVSTSDAMSGKIHFIAIKHHINIKVDSQLIAVQEITVLAQCECVPNQRRNCGSIFLC